jgi:hypothetical protein
MGFARLLHLTGDCTRHFSQVERTISDNPVTVIGVCAQGVQTHRAWQQFIPNPPNRDVIRSNIDLTVMQTTSFDPVDYWLATPWFAEFAGETFLRQSDVPGTVSQQDTYTSIQVQELDHNWYDTCAGSRPLYHGTDLSRYSANTLSCDSAVTWTNNPGGP